VRTSYPVLVASICSLLVLVGCAAENRQVYFAFSGPEARQAELATLDIKAAYELIIDDMYYVSKAKYDTVRLMPGVHRIKWKTRFGVSVMVEPSGYSAFYMVSDITVEAGHIYRLCSDRTTGHGYKVYCWIEDTTAGKIVWGEKKP